MMIFFGVASLREAVAEYLEHYHREHNHQGLGNQIPTPGDEVGRQAGQIKRCDRLGGLLRDYYREAA